MGNINGISRPDYYQIIIHCAKQRKIAYGSVVVIQLSILKVCRAP